MGTKRIKLLRKCLVGTDPRPKPVGWVGDVAQAEAIGLTAVGFAKETKDDLSKEVQLQTVEGRLPIGTKDVRSTDPAKNGKLSAILEGKVDEVVAQLDDLTTEELNQLLALEEASKTPRKGVIDAINEYDLTGEGE